MKKYFYPVCLFILTVLIFLTNVRSGTYLSGWDNLQTELHPTLAIKRALFAVWEEYQSFGLVSGMAHAADLPRAVFLFFISFILPQNLIRYFFHTLMLLLGGLGMFYLLKTIVFQKTRAIFAFVGAVFYLLNLGTVQIFSLPFEPFSVFFGFLPWEVLFFIKTVGPEEKQSRKQSLLALAVVNLLGAAQSYVQTIFVVYIALLTLMALGVWINSRKFAVAKNALAALLLIFLVNAFWLLPQFYFLKTAGPKQVEAAKINQLATEDIFYLNKEKGTLQSFITMKGFYYDLMGMNKQLLFLVWQNHFKQPFNKPLPYILTLFVIVGFFVKKKYHLSFIFCFILIMMALLNATPPFSSLNDFLRQNEFINQIFRSPFTKFMIPYALVSSYFFGAGVEWLTSQLLRRKNPPLTTIGPFFVVLLMILYSLPSFRGHFFSPAMKVKIPTEYQELINYLKNQDKNKRIALLPDYTFWGWFLHRWGYNGSGFLWYGLEQPIVSRTFDVWSEKSEGYFWEVKNALEAEDVGKFENILDKYAVDYLVFDRSLLPVSSVLKSVQYERLENVLHQNRTINLVKQWSTLSLYSVSRRKPMVNFVSLVQTLPRVGPAVKLTNEDAAYDRFADYENSQNPDIIYPFFDLASQTRVEKKTWSLRQSQNSFILARSLNLNNQYIVNLSYGKPNALIFDDNQIQFQLYESPIDLHLDKQEITVVVPVISLTNFISKETHVTNCSFTPWKGQNIVEFNRTHDRIRISSQNGATACFGYDASFLEQRYGYLVRVETKNRQGRRLFFYILDKTKKQTYVEDRLQQDAEYYLISPKYEYGSGYVFAFHNNSYENQPSVNEVIKLTVYLFPYTDIKNLFLTKQSRVMPSPAVFSDDFVVKKNQYFLYTVRSNNFSSNQTLVLNQAFEKNWRAYRVETADSRRLDLRFQNLFKTFFPFIFGTEIKNHVLVNNWANGWRLDNNLESNNPKSNNLTSITIVFLPQYLEFLGFGMLIITFCGLFFLKSNKSNLKD